MKILVSSALIIPHTGTAALAHSNITKTDSSEYAETEESESGLDFAPQKILLNAEPGNNAHVSGTSGVHWDLDKDNILTFDAGELNRDDSWKNYADRICEIRVAPKGGITALTLPSDSSNLFEDLSSLTGIEDTEFDTSNVTNMSSMFAGCRSLKDLDLSSFDTSNVTDMSSMFFDCSSLKDLDLSSFNTGNVTNMANMFNSCFSLTNVILTSFDTTSTASMADMFHDCTSLQTLDLSSFETPCLDDMHNMFANCGSLTKLDLSGFDTSGVSYGLCNKMFCGCFSLNTVNLSKDFFKGDMSGSCPLTQEDTWKQIKNLHNVKCWSEMIQTWKDEDAGWWKLYDPISQLTFHTGGGTEYPSLHAPNGYSIDLSDYLPCKDGYYFIGWYLDPECTQKADSPYILDSDTNLYAGWEAPEYAFGVSGVNWSVSKDGVLYFDAGELNREDSWRAYKSRIHEIRVNPANGRTALTLPHDCSDLFSGFSSLTDLDADKLDMTEARKMNRMFEGCKNLKQISLSEFSSSEWLGMNRMFADCESLENASFTSSHPIYVDDIAGIFSGCINLQKANLIYLRDGHLESMAEMFYNCRSLTKLDLPNFGSIWLKSTEKTFANCSSLETLDLSGLVTWRIENGMSANMFSGCSSLKRIKLSKYFFKGDMEMCAPDFMSTSWVKENSPKKFMPWPKMINPGDTEIPGWWRLIDNSSCFLSFDGNGGTTPATECLLNGTSIDLHEFTSDRQYYDFTGWYLDPECTKKADSTLTLNTSTTLYAGWKIQNRTVYYDTDGGSEMPPVSRPIGTAAVSSKNKPVKKGYTFTGWYYDKEHQKPAYYPSVARFDMTLYAGWKIQSRTLSFDTKGGSELKPIVCDYGTVVAPRHYFPVKEGCTFAGWYTDSACTQRANMQITMESDITLYAAWIKDSGFPFFLPENN
ncbi:MAG: BspA family leucine-rich repeat surface protein [Erysipelotrichaceae bacterium]|nr:BspA family leucine-rich repeat surface protein [Erysipelotrichaceae bacterium]